MSDGEQTPPPVEENKGQTFNAEVHKVEDPLKKD